MIYSGACSPRTIFIINTIVIVGLHLMNRDSSCFEFPSIAINLLEKEK